MRKIFLGLMLITIALYANQLFAQCATSHAVQHPQGNAISNIVDTGATCPLCVANYWCLSIGAANNNGTNTAWWTQVSAGNWRANGDWANTGNVGCCGMWDAGNDSRTMAFKNDDNRNDGTATHQGEYAIQLRERPTAGTTFFFALGTIPMRIIPTFFASNFASTGPGGTSSFSLAGWNTINGPGPAHFQVRLSNNTNCDTSVAGTCALTNYCTPYPSACPQAIAGYQVRYMFAGCADGSCTSPAPAPPTVGTSTSWTAAAGGLVTPRVPTFPVAGVSATNPATNTAANAYLFFATQLVYQDGYASAYVSRNSAAFRWGTLGAEIAGFSATYVSRSDIRVDWKSVTEGMVSGYNVYRSTSPTGTFNRINAKTIAATGNEGSFYAYKDRISSTPRNYYYKIEVVRPDGKTEMQANIAVATVTPSGPKLPRI